MKNKLAFYGSLLGILLVMTLIFCFSSQSGDESGEQSQSIVEIIVKIVYPKLDEKAPAVQISILNQVSHFIRKMAHFSEFTLLGVVLSLHFCTYRRFHAGWKTGILAWAIGTVYAVTDEVHQIFVPGRGPAVTDVVIDSSGVITGCLLVWLLLCYVNYRKTERVMYRDSTRSKKKGQSIGQSNDFGGESKPASAKSPCH